MQLACLVGLSARLVYNEPDIRLDERFSSMSILSELLTPELMMAMASELFPRGASRSATMEPTPK